MLLLTPIRRKPQPRTPLVVRGRAGSRGRPLASSQHGGLEVRVTAGVLDQVVAAHEALVTKRTPKLLLPRVGAVMTGQLVGAGKLLTAVWPGTWEWPFSWKKKEKGGEMFIYIVTQETQDFSSVAIRTTV